MSLKNLIICLGLLWFWFLPSFAHGSQCEPLKEDGISKGLYGLCNALCDAMEASYEEPLSNSQQRVYDNYNNKKNENDPDAPCMIAPDPEPATCFLWTYEDQVAAAQFPNGRQNDSTQETIGWLAPFGIFDVSVDYSILPVNDQGIVIARVANDGFNYGDPEATYIVEYQLRHAASGTLDIRSDNTLSKEEFDQCYQSIVDFTLTP